MSKPDDQGREQCDVGGCGTTCHSFINIFPSVPFEFEIQIPGKSLSIQIGGRNLKSRRRMAQRSAGDPEAHVSLAALLLSQDPVNLEHAEEAVKELHAALELLPESTAQEDPQELAMIHKFLGDALLVLGQSDDARKHWNLAIKFDPVPPPYGFSGPALEQLTKHPAN